MTGKWGVRSMVWDVLLLVIAFCVAIYYYLQLVNDPSIQRIFFS